MTTQISHPRTQTLNLYNCINNKTKFRITQEINVTINCLHLLVHRRNTGFKNDINTKSMTKYKTIHFTPLHHIERKKSIFPICLIQMESITNKHYCSGHYSWNCVFYNILLARRLDYILQADLRRLELENKTQTSVQLMGSAASPFSGGSVNSVDIAVGQNTRHVRKLGWGRGSWFGGNEESVGGCISKWWHARELNPRLL